jgi:hypothetical protein
LDGLPLAIELAAARLIGLSVADVNAQLDDGMRLLARRRPMLGRHQSLSAAIQWSYELLSTDEREVFEAISCFVGDFDLVSAVAVADPSSPDRVAACIASLIEKSMLTSEVHVAGRRFRLLETIREFALLHLRERGGEGVVRRRLLDRFVSMVQDAKIGLRGSDEPHWHEVLRAEWHSLRTAMDIACDLDAGRDACALVDGTFWWGLTRSRAEVGEWAERTLLLSSVEALPIRVVPLAAAAYFAGMRGDHARAVAAFGSARDEERRAGPWAEPWVSVVAPFVVDPSAILAANIEAQERARDAGDLFWEVVGLLQEGATRGFLMTMTNFDSGPVDVHLQRIRLGSELAAQLGNPNGIAYASKNLGAAVVTREPDLAERLLEQSLAIAGPLGLELLAGQARTSLAQLYSGLGRPRDALDVLAVALRAHLRAGALSDLAYALALMLPDVARVGQPLLAASPIGALHDLDEGLCTLVGLDVLEAQLRSELTNPSFEEIVDRGRRLGLTECARELARAVQEMPREPGGRQGVPQGG